MSIETSADRAAMLDTMGETFHWNGAPFAAVFEIPYEIALGLGGSLPALTTDPDLIDGVAVGDTVTRVFGPVDYTVRSIEDDGFGMVRMMLERV